MDGYGERIRLMLKGLRDKEEEDSRIG